MKIARNITLIAILIITTALGLLHQFKTSFVTVPVDSFCPFGGLETMFNYILTGRFLQRLSFNNIILIGIIIITGIILGKTFCGNICPLGFMQEIFTKLRNKLKIKRVELPKTMDKILRALKFVVLIATLYFTYKFGILVIRSFDPWATYHHIVSSDLFTEFSIGFIVLIGSLILSFFVDRAFCKYLCPQGAFLSILSKLSLTKIYRNKETCTNCKICTKVCPMNIEVHTQDKIKTSECISCNECINSCPTKVSSLEQKVFGKKTLNTNIYLLLTILLFSTPIIAGTINNTFVWRMRQVKSMTKETFNPELIRGMNTFKEVADVTKISKEAFVREFNIAERKFESPIRETIDTEEVREFVRHYLETNK